MVLLKQLFTYSIVVLIFICTASQSSAQNSKKAKKSYDKALKLIEKGKYDDVFSLLLGAVVEEKELEEGQDRKFIGEVFALYARFFVSETYYGAASQYFFLAALNYQRGGSHCRSAGCHTTSLVLMKIQQESIKVFMASKVGIQKGNIPDTRFLP